MFLGVYGHQLAMVVMELGLWVTSQVISRCAQVFHGYDVAQLFGSRGNRNEWQDDNITTVRWMDGWMDGWI